MSGTARGAALAVRDLRVAYALPDGGRLDVLDIANLDIPAGAQVAVQGPSGSGKTSLVHVLAGIERPGSGSVVWDGVDIFALGEGARDGWRRAHVGLVFQQFHLFPGLSPLENVLLPARFAHVVLPAAVVRRARELLDTVGVRRAGDVSRSSRGEMQRVAIARALLFAPKVLVADEPTASLDAATGSRIIDLLFACCAGDATTFIAITHDPAFARRFATVYELTGGALHPVLAREAAAE